VDRNDDDGVVLLIGSGRQLYREYLLSGLARRAAVWLIDEQPMTWQRPYVAGGTVVRPLDHERMVPDQPGLIDAAVRIARDRKVTGVVTYDEALVIAAAHVAEALGVPGLTVSGARNCRDKHRSRTALRAAGLPQPGFALARTLGEATRAAAGFGYPVVVKPRGLAASIGVARVTGPEDLARAFAVVERARRAGPPDFEDGALIEELVEGPEISIDGVISAGSYQPFCLARKRLGPPPCFEETGHLVDAADPLAADPALRSVLARAHEALGVPDGVTHTEVRMAARGPVIIEVNARLGGDLIPYLGLLATGTDPGQVAADAAAGMRPDVRPRQRRCAGVRFLYPPEDCRVLGISVPGTGAIPGLVSARAMVPPGATVRLPPRAHLGRHALVIATADTPDACERVLDEAAALVGLRYEPLGDADSFDGPPW
jgi:biotin carboxylase